MRKLTLDLSTVSVESFSIDASGLRRQGTVLAMESTFTSTNYSGEVSCGFDSCVSGCSCPPGY